MKVPHHVGAHDQIVLNTKPVGLGELRKVFIVISELLCETTKKWSDPRVVPEN